MKMMSYRFAGNANPLSLSQISSHGSRMFACNCNPFVDCNWKMWLAFTTTNVAMESMSYDRMTWAKDRVVCLGTTDGRGRSGFGDEEFPSLCTIETFLYPLFEIFNNNPLPYWLD